MRRAWKFYDASQKTELLIQRRSSLKPTTIIPDPFPTSTQKPTNTLSSSRLFSSYPSISSASWPISYGSLIGLFDKSYPNEPKAREELSHKVSQLKDELVKCTGDSEGLYSVLDEKGLPLFAYYLDGSALVQLLEQLRGLPLLAVEVFNWRRKHGSFTFPITHVEYSKAITAAGRSRNLDLALELFQEAANNHIKTSSTYNALMGAYMSNGLSEKCQLVFQEFKRDDSCSPTTVTYNILISVFGRLMLVDHMEATLKQIYDSNLLPNVNTFNTLIAGYVTAWMWDRMEEAFRMMEVSSIKPDVNTYMLMLRGYCHAGKLEKMEPMYEMVKQCLGGDDVNLLRCMVCAYCKSSCANRIEKIEEITKLMPKEQYCSWLNVLLIRVYAQERVLERMEKHIDDALEHHTIVRAVGVMRSIITVYYRLNVVDKLAGFIKRAEGAGWRICRSLYHCKMVMYGSQNRLVEMESVLAEMEKLNLNVTKKTLIILYKAYSIWGPRCKREQVFGMICKHGYEIY